MFVRFPYPQPGTREDYLMMVVMWHVATPEELQEWQKVYRPLVLKNWEEMHTSVVNRVQRSITDLRKQAIDWRKGTHNDSYGTDIEYALERANQCEAKASYAEDMLKKDILIEGYSISYKGLVNER